MHPVFDVRYLLVFHYENDDATVTLLAILPIVCARSPLFKLGTELMLDVSLNLLRIGRSCRIEDSL